MPVRNPISDKQVFKTDMQGIFSLVIPDARLAIRSHTDIVIRIPLDTRTGAKRIGNIDIRQFPVTNGGFLLREEINQAIPRQPEIGH